MSYEPLNQSKFVQKYRELSSEIAQLLDFPPPEDQEEFIEKYFGRVFDRIRELSMAENYKSRDVELYRVSFLIKHLRNIKDYDKELLDRFKQLFKEGDYNNYFGTRFEVAICLSFIDKNLDFEKRESPDFEIGSSDKIFVECVSTHLTKEQDRSLEYKIKSAIDSKIGKSYDSEDTVLMLEYTNLSHNMASTNASLKDKEGLKSEIKPVLEESNYGSLILFSFFFKNKNFRSVYIRIDNNSIDTNLEDFLDQNYSKGSFHVNRPFYPRES